MRRAGPLAVLACWALLSVFTPGATARTLIATVDWGYQSFALEAYDESVVWMAPLPRVEGEGGEQRDVAVFVRDAAGVRTLPALTIRSDDVLIRSADLGPGVGRGPALVFARCTDEGEFVGICSVVRAELSGGPARPVRGASAERYHEFAPSVWRERVAFVRAPAEAYSGRYPVPRPLRGIFATSPLTRLAPLPGCCFSDVPIPDRDTDLRGRTLAYSTFDLIERREGGRPVQLSRTKIVVKRFDRHGRGRSCVVAQALSGGGRRGVSLSQPQLGDDGYVYWLAISPGEDSRRSSVQRRPMPTRRCLARGQRERMPLHSAPSGSETHAAALAVAKGRVYYALVNPFGPARIWEASSAEFTRR